MKDDTRETRWSGHTPRFLLRTALLACLALVVAGLGVTLVPGGPEQPVEAPFSERARAAALSDTLRLRSSGGELSSSGPAPGRPAVELTVNLLTSQARALLAPGQDEAALTASGQPPSATASAAASASAPQPGSVADLASELAASANRRLADAAVSDGGLARLLAAVGTAQLLQASTLAAAAGSQLPASDATVPLPSPTPCAVTVPPPAAGGPATPGGTPAPGSPAAGAATLGTALEAAVRTERQSIYAYELALTRLSGDAAKAAAEQMGRHRELVRGVETLSRHHCQAPPPEDAGYAAAGAFLASPAAGLAALEAEALPVFGDLVALSDGETRTWAISALIRSARGAALWGAAPGPLPGLVTDAADFPPLPAAGPNTGP